MVGVSLLIDVNEASFRLSASRGVNALTRGVVPQVVYPGDTLSVKMWDEGSGASIFQTVNQEGVVVIDGGRFQLA